MDTIRPMVRLLEGPELAAYDVVPRTLACRLRVVKTRLLPPGIDGMALGRTVFVRRDRSRKGDDPLLAHELVHVRQWAEQGRIGFVVRYVCGYLTGLVEHRNHRDAYLAIDAEVAARRETAAWVRKARRRSR